MLVAYILDVVDSIVLPDSPVLRLLVCVVAGLLLISTTSANCLHDTAFYGALKKRTQLKPFGYTDRLSPLNWANLDSDCNACSTSKNQSPINLDNTTAFAREVPQIDIPIIKTVQLLNTGTAVEVLHKNRTTIFTNETFNLLQFHFHIPSEHRVNDEYFPLEMHMVHENAGMYIVKAMF